MENNSNNMTHNSSNLMEEVNISQEAIAIIDEFSRYGIDRFANREGDIDEMDASNLLWNRRFQLIASLYAKQPNSKFGVVVLLDEYSLDLEQIFSEEELKILEKEYINVVKYCALSKGAYRPLPENDMVIPTLVVELCTKLASVKPGSDVLLAGSCMGQFSYMHNDCNYYGYEKSEEVWALSQIMFDVFNVNADIQNCQFDEFSRNNKKQYDYIFVTHSFGGNDKLEDELISLATNYLKENGQMLCFLPYSFAMGRWKNFEKVIIDSAFETEVIELPDNLYCGVISWDCILSLKKNHIGEITLVDATRVETKNQSYNWRFISADNIIDIIKKKDNRYVWVGKSYDLLKNDDLRASIRLLDQNLLVAQKNEKIMALDELVEIVKCESAPISNMENLLLPKIDVKVLSDDYLRCDLQYNMIPKNEDGGLIRSLSEDALLFGLYNLHSRVSRFHYEGKKVALSSSVKSFRLKKQKVITEEFLLRSLTLEEIARQAYIYMRNQFELSDKDFLKIKIVVPQLERQNEICQNESRALLSEMDRKLLEEHEDFRRDIHMKIHTIGQTIFNIDNLMDGLQTMRQRGNGVVSDSDVYGIKNPISVANIYDNLKNAIERLKRQVASFDRGYNKVPKDIALTDFIEEYIKHHQYTDLIYEYEPEKHHFSFSYKGVVGEVYYDDNGNPVSAEYNPDEYYFEKGDPIEWVKFPPEALTIIFDNIISNARAHGFSGREGGDNKVKIEIEQDDTNYVITIANNGKPLHPQLNEKYVFTYGVTSQTGSNHSGIGAHEVSELMREFGGRAEFISTPDEEYTVTYRLTFTETDIIKLF